mmetsp:Transcript_58323/g.87937  ORF Transcript_58323/g.87937 Transcript_58323/m.87937 type:complete len:384 (-) Transcript_58323:309-1460(-)|eukprot:CAMPEP_0116998922 /NCGR_PEP_ID=MMETSP0472-20121206/1828_1 /TAXON_ID=693140 ORGANISM="Tiarina fusus, Strain LIS" /NCGR_SAMPLE_ID=MMETSP0472 /ASSEMBLY_ACC=CAM_ASM_000603 /LENGTH=383 /DNA_ID=CAMNT_0004698227 /DNA_START=80 /DNA_END=1231 /DNA_ORIENTATION=+
MTRIKVATAQLPHRNYDVAGNITRGVKAVEEAANKGAKLVLLPELFATGYLCDAASLWEMAEVLEGGPTVMRMTHVANRCNICVAFTILEASKTSSHFYNTFVLVEPSGKLHVCHKSEPAAFECFAFTGDSSMSPILDTSLGRIAVSICYENMLTSQQRRLVADADEDDENAKTPFDMLLCPHSAPTTNECMTFPRQNIFMMNQMLEQTPMRLAKLFGVPIIMSNKIGPLVSKNPWPFWLVPTRHTFQGFSSICAGDCFWGSAALNKLEDGGKQEVLVADVSLGEDNRPISKVKADLNKLKAKGRYVVDLPAPLPTVWTYIMEPVGKCSYTLSYPWRRAAAGRARARGPEPSTYKPSTGFPVLKACALGALVYGAVQLRKGKQ